MGFITKDLKSPSLWLGGQKEGGEGLVKCLHAFVNIFLVFFVCSVIGGLVKYLHVFVNIFLVFCVRFMYYTALYSTVQLLFAGQLYTVVLNNTYSLAIRWEE